MSKYWPEQASQFNWKPEEMSKYWPEQASQFNWKPEDLSYITRDPESAYRYALDYKKGRWLEAECYIKTDSYWAYRYAIDVIRGRWPEAESCIKKDSEWGDKYTIYVEKLNHCTNVTPPRTPQKDERNPLLLRVFRVPILHTLYKRKIP